MFNIRLKQLKRRIYTYYSQLTNLSIQQFASQVLAEVFGENWENTEDVISPIQDILIVLDQINILGQIFGRGVSHMAVEEPHHEIFYKLQCLFNLGKIFIQTLSENECNFSDFNPRQIILSEEKFETLQNQLRPIKKNENHSLTTIESIVQYVLDHAFEEYNEFCSVNSWNELLSYIFQVDLEDETKGAKKIKQTNIKELLLSEQVEGALIESIFRKYDGLLAYTMSMLTMLSSTKYSEKYTPYLNKILEKLGTSTKVILLQGRLTKDFEILHELEKDIRDLQTKISGKIKSLQIAISEKKIQNFFNYLLHLPKLSKEMKFPESLEEAPGFEELTKNGRIKMMMNSIIPKWSHYKEIFTDIRNSLINFDEFFDKMIRGVNDITADLFAEGFQASIPLQDVETCERAGIHVKNLTATFSSQKTQISDEDFDIKQKLLRKFEDMLHDLQTILRQKTTEEEAIKVEPQIFTPLLNIISGLYTQWTENKVLSAFKEEAIMVSRYLQSILNIIESIYKKIKPFEKKFLNRENIKNLQVEHEYYMDKMSEIMMILKVSLFTNDLTKNIWHLSRDYVLKIGKNAKYIINPDEISKLISDMPKTLKREYMQRLITQEQRKEKMKYYSKVNEIIENLKNIPLSERELLIPYEEIKKMIK
ncbi:MAG: hypothetical protein K9W44_17930 [Candidatus Lokiarchaeota archaeon]|nr:hypothetical protein [Candidatus Harpocratesius repetitus]